MPAYQSGLVSDWDRRFRQRRANSGRGLTYGETTAINENLLNLDYQKSIAAEERAQNLAITNRQLNLQEQAAKDAARAAKVSGVTDIAGGAANLYFANKYLNLMGANAAPMGGVPGLAAPGALTAPATGAAPSLATATSFGGAAGGGAASATGGAAAAGTATAPTLAAPTAFAPSMLAGESAAPAAAAAGPGLAATAGAGLVGAGLGYGLSKVLGANEDISQGLTLGGAGIGIGFMVGGPVGAVVGGVIGAAVSLFDDLF